MAELERSYKSSLFYSYSHKDSRHKENMDTSLAQLKSDNFISSWSDEEILPGRSISSTVTKKIDQADIVCFLISQDFLASEECIKEWNRVKSRALVNARLFRIPIILEDCAWLDFLGDDDIKALPSDGTPVTRFGNSRTAWHQVYEGIRVVATELRNTFTPRTEFTFKMKQTDFLSTSRISLQDIFVFLRLSSISSISPKGRFLEDTIESEDQLLARKRLLVEGEELSGKTALSRYIFLRLCSQSKAVIHLDLKELPAKSPDNVLRETYYAEFFGDYDMWKQQADKTLILDNLSSDPNAIDFLVGIKTFFSRILVFASSDVVASFFKDDDRLAEFDVMTIRPLSHVQQEDLIRKRLALSQPGLRIADGTVDQIEDRVNSIILSNKIVPRYPFYVLSILQTYEAYMPDNLTISSYGHCYHALIVAMLIKAGVQRTDSDIDACFNFAENLAFCLYRREERLGAEVGEFGCSSFAEFVGDYKNEYLISNATVNRMRHREYGIITSEGEFRSSFMYYFFLGRCFARNREKYAAHISRICEQSYMGFNHLVLLFTIHHTSDSELIDDIMLRTMCTLDEFEPASLDHEETARFLNVLSSAPQNILSERSVRDERKIERVRRENAEKQMDDGGGAEDEGSGEWVNDMYRVFRSNKVLGQILRNKYGSLSRAKIEELVETIADSGLRLVNSVLSDEEEIRKLAVYLRKKYPKSRLKRIENALRLLSFLWTIANIESIVGAVNVPEVREAVMKVVERKSTVAYDIVGYFSRLDSEKELTEDIRTELEQLLKTHKGVFVKSVLSLRTQYYINTHTNKSAVEQSVCSLLGIPYRFRPGRT